MFPLAILESLGKFEWILEGIWKNSKNDFVVNSRKNSDENRRWFLMENRKHLNQNTGQFSIRTLKKKSFWTLEEFWCECWKYSVTNSDDNRGRILEFWKDSILEALCWESWKNYVKNPGMTLWRTLKAFYEESQKDSDENIWKGLMRIL